MKEGSTGTSTTTGLTDTAIMPDPQGISLDGYKGGDDRISTKGSRKGGKKSMSY